MLAPLVCLAVILALLSRRVRDAAANWLERGANRIFAVPALLTLLFAAHLAVAGVLKAPLVVLVAAYTLLPVAIARLLPSRPGEPAWLDLAVILLMWLPLELGAGARWVPRELQGSVHTAAYGVAVTLALVVFLLYRRMPDIKYQWPQRKGDLLSVLAGYALAAPVLILVARQLSFIEPFHIPAGLSAGWLLRRFALILVATALPEELLFRGLIQNWLMQKFGATNRVLLAAALIFGAAHLNNSPGPAPNWRYMVLATLAGLAYGKVFQRSSSIVSPALLHALVNTTRHAFF